MLLTRYARLGGRCNSIESIMTSKGQNLQEVLNKALSEELRLLKQYGVSHIGYRYYLNDGRSFGCPTSEGWYKTNRDENFYKTMLPFLSSELINLAANRHSIVTRSKDHAADPYLDYLREMKMDNSVGIYRFGQNRIESLFFICESSRGEQKDVALNNIRYLEKHVNKLLSKLDQYSNLMVTNDDYEFALEEQTLKTLFDSESGASGRFLKHVKLNFDGQHVYLTKRELQTLQVMQYSVSNKCIASKLNVSPKTVEKHLSKLKDKLGVFNRDALIEISHLPQLQTLYEREYNENRID